MPASPCRIDDQPPDFIRQKHRYGTTPTGPGEYRDGNTPLARPKDAATLIVVRGGTHPPRVLMGKRASSPLHAQ